VTGWGLVLALVPLMPRYLRLRSPRDLEQEVRARRKAEERLRVSEEMFRSVAETAKDAIVSADTNERIIFFNRRAERVFGYEAKEVLGKPLSYLFPRNPHTRLKSLAGADSSTLGKPSEGLGRRKDGGQFPLEMTLTFGKTSAGILITFIIRDITERKQAEQVLRQSRDELEARVQERTAELARANEKLRGEIRERMGIEEVLRRRERELAASLKEKEVLLREIQHRVKNNLQVIASLHSLQADSIKDPAALAVFQESRNRILSLALVHEMLYHMRDMSRINFHEYIRKLAANVFQSYGIGPERIVLRLDAEPIALELDQAIPCGLIINELISNSLKHAFPAGRRGEIAIGLHRRAPSQVELTVGDNGVGMPKNVDYRRSDSLGLQLVQTLTDQLDAAVEKTNSHGTRFRITFQAHVPVEGR
jgi:PAS domain S-box-containing protein